MEKGEEVGNNIKEWTGLDFASSDKTAGNGTIWKRVCCEVLCGAPLA